jgi:hypothetical protein
MSTVLEKFNVNPLFFFEEAQWYDHNRTNSRNRAKPLQCPIAQIPPFQVVKYGGNAISEIKLIHYDTSTETDVKTEMELTGFELKDFITANGYELMVYPGTVTLPISGMQEGLHYLRIRDGAGNYILSEMFTFHDGIAARHDFIKVEWWHQEDFEYGGQLIGGVEKPRGHIVFDYPFKYWAYLKTDIINPTYKYESRISKRKGKNLPLEQIRYKEHRFTFFAAEYFVDAFSLVPLFDQVRITHMGREYEVDEISVEPDTAGGGGGVIPVKCVFRTDTAAVINGRAYTDLAYTPADGACLADAIVCAAIITFGSAEYTGKYWTDEFGANHSFISGEYVVIDTGGLLAVRKFDGTNYVSFGPVNYTNFTTPQDSRTGQLARGDYYFFEYNGNLAEAPYITTTTPGATYNVVGRSFGNSLVQVISKDGTGTEWISATVTSEVFRTAGANFPTVDAGRTVTAYKVRAASYACTNIAENSYAVLAGVGFDQIGSTLQVYAEAGPPSPEAPPG